MSWISIILLIVKYLPDIINLVKEIIGLIGNIGDKRQVRIELRKLRHGVQLAKSSRDFKPLEQQLERLKERFGVQD